MEEFCSKLAQILDVPEVKPTDVLSDFEEWDSLSILSVIAMASSDYRVTLHASHLWEIGTVQELHDRILAMGAKQS